MIQHDGITIIGNFKRTSQEQRLAIVGPRKSTPQLDRVAYDLGFKMVQRGYHVVSGLANGIDYRAMQGAIQALKNGHKGGVIALMPCLYPEVYPKANKPLLDEVLKYGYAIYPYSEKTFELEQYKNNYYERYPNMKYDIVQLLTDRSILNGEICNQVHVVTDDEKIKGGSRYAPTKSLSLGIPTYRWNSDFKYTTEVVMSRKVNAQDTLYVIQNIRELIDL